MNTITHPLTPDEQSRLITHIQESGYETREVAHAILGGKKPGLNIVLYKSGKLVVQGKGCKEWVEFVLEPLILQRVISENSEHTHEEALPASHIGIDESGKGDFFGPMVIAAYHVPPSHYKGLLKLGVRDSKKISSDKKITEIAEKLLHKTPDHCEVFVLNLNTYNSLVKKMGSVNRVLAWAHATVLENLLARFPDTPRAVADQFGPEHQIISALKERGKNILLEQRHKAESDPAVAAASILARHRFVQEMKELSDTYNCELPRGATHVRPSAEKLVRRDGPEILTQVAKIHFRTTRQVLTACGYDPALLGTPEPKDSSHWKKKRKK